MKATDLMVGDWVMNACDTPRKVYELAQDQVTYELEGGGLNTAHCNQLYPIPLTEDILVKNGFDCQYYDDGNSYWWAVFDGWFNINFDHSDCSEGEFRCVNFRDLVIKSVHQLQHLLRLCGIEKEITI